MTDGDQATPRVIRVRIDYSDGTWRQLTGEDACQQWVDMAAGQASMAHVHGCTYQPLPWEEGGCADA